MAHILVVDDDIDICNLLEKFLKRNGYQVDTALTGKLALEKISNTTYDLCFCDFRLSDMEGRDFITRSHEIFPYLKIVIITGYSDVRTSVDVMKRGALDYIIKPLIPDEILNIINNAIALPEQPRAITTAPVASSTGTATKKHTGKHQKESEFIVGVSPSAQTMHNEVKLVASTNFSVVIYGESGAGKENIARTIHDLSQRKSNPFIAIDCGALTKELAGSELWGHEKGAFTGALNAKPGQFELANGGTIFLDEIANLSYEIQVGLLRLVQERKLRRVGGTRDIEIDVRIIVASNENLAEAVKKGKFREDLYYRFNEFNVNVPALREMPDDILSFATHFLEKANRELNKEITGFDDEVIRLFKTYKWPGNLREMRNVVRRSALLSNGQRISVSCLPQEIVNHDKFITPVFEEFQQQEVQQTTSGSVSQTNFSGIPDLKGASANAEAEIIKKVLEEVKYNRTKAAEKLGIDRKTLFNKMKLYNL